MRGHGSTTYHRLVRIGQRLPRWLALRIDPYNTVADRFVRSLARSLQSGDRVVDAGAGECRFAEVFRAFRYYGTDNRVGEAGTWDYSRLAFASDLTRMPLADRSVDGVISLNVLEHLSDPVPMLEEFRRVLRPGGRLHLVAPQSWWLHQSPHDYFRYTRYGLEVLLARAGLEAKSIEPIGGAFWNLGTRSLHLLTFFDGAWFPLALLLAPLLGFAVPVLCFYLDGLDRRRDDTLGHLVVATPAAPSS